MRVGLYTRISEDIAGEGLRGGASGARLPIPRRAPGLDSRRRLRGKRRVRLQDDTSAVLARDLKRLDWSGRRPRSSLPIRRVDTRELKPNSDLASSGLGTIHIG
jgi:hypothetical protein